ncbi:hypothetical protein [Hoeflea ulvae]|uniref:Alanine and proline-rich secreted protein Apa n=1 Tax=Hoeflea ulvae TaxID=2983764 RepID=A0ABT3YIS1_9HYPH|nr:hypothetical protein [Hoeflea ulvae]MCY0095781.1 hypothetical protein [Hoeflea ulvae]
MGDRRNSGFETGRLKDIAALSVALFVVVSTGPALSLSELAPAQPPSEEVEQGAPLPPLDEPQTGLDGGLPEPGPVIRTTPQSGEPASEAGVTEELPPVEILTDFTQLPEPARRMRQLMLDAAATGEIENLRPLLGTGPTATQLSFGEIEADPVAYLRSISGDGEGQEILAILIDLLNTGFVRIDAGDANETYIWPYFAALPLDGLTPPQQVELLRIVTAGDVEDMKAYGGYNFYRAGISPDGEWRFFVAGD